MAGNNWADEPIFRQVRVNIENQTQRQLLIQNHFDIVWSDKDFVEVIAADKDLQSLIKLGIEYNIVHENVIEFYQSRLANKDMGGYRALSEIESYLNAMVEDHPDIISPAQSIGLTIEGRDIWAYKISDFPHIDQAEPEIFFNSAIHAREAITPEVLLNYMDYLTDNYGTDASVTELVNNREIWFVVVANPDGYYYNEVSAPLGGGMWRKNRRENGDSTFGVDLNRNFGYKWGYDDIGSSPLTDDVLYRGASAFSEPETQALRDFIIYHNFSLVVNYHSYSNVILYPWSYQIGLYADDDDLFDAIGNNIFKHMAYYPSPGWAFYPANGSCDDWCYGDTLSKSRIPSITVEVGNYDDGFWPTEERKIELISENLPVCLYLTEIAEKIEQALPPNMPTMVITESNSTGSYNIDWTLYDPDNPPIVYELIEYADHNIITDPMNNFDAIDNCGFVADASGFGSSPCLFSGTKSTIERYFQTIVPYRVQPSDTFKFMTRYYINQDVDYAYVEISTDKINYIPIEGNITTMDNPGGYNRGHGITGTTNDLWVEGLFDLNDYVGQDVYFRISYRDFHIYEAGNGIRIDNIYPVSGFDSMTIIPDTLIDTTMFVTGKSNGVYYYRVRAMDADSQWSDYSVFDSIVVNKPTDFICGDTNNDDDVNLLDVLYMIDFIYGVPPGPEPDPYISGDVNGFPGHGYINLLDVLYLISNLYDSPPGPEPECP